MPETSADPRAHLGAATRALLARAEGADARGRAALQAAIDDVFLSPDLRLDDRTRNGLTILVNAMVTAVAGELVDRSGKLLMARGEGQMADALANDRSPVVEKLADAGLLSDRDFIGECIARVRADQIAAALPNEAPGEPDTPSLLVRLTESPDRVVAGAATAVLAGESHRRAPAEGRPLAGTGLPASLHGRLVWWVAAALRARALSETVGDPDALDRAIAEAALRNVTAYDDGDRVETAAMRLSAAIDAQADELPALLDETLRDRRLPVFAALLAHALGVGYDLARDVVLDPAGDRLWLVLRALELPRDAIARIGYALSEADPRRDLEDFADMLDVIADIPPEVARTAVAPLRLHPDYRAAVMAFRGNG